MEASQTVLDPSIVKPEGLVSFPEALIGEQVLVELLYANSVRTGRRLLFMAQMSPPESIASPPDPGLFPVTLTLVPVAIDVPKSEGAGPPLVQTMPDPSIARARFPIGEVDVK